MPYEGESFDDDTITQLLCSDHTLDGPYRALVSKLNPPCSYIRTDTRFCNLCCEDFVPNVQIVFCKLKASISQKGVLIISIVQA